MQGLCQLKICLETVVDEDESSIFFLFFIQIVIRHHLDFFTKEKYNVYSTQYSGLYTNRVVPKKTNLEINLDSFSELVENYQDYVLGDKSFELTSNGKFKVEEVKDANAKTKISKIVKRPKA